MIRLKNFLSLMLPLGYGKVNSRTDKKEKDKVVMRLTFNVKYYILYRKSELLKKCYERIREEK